MSNVRINSITVIQATNRQLIKRKFIIFFIMKYLMNMIKKKWKKKGTVSICTSCERCFLSDGPMQIMTQAFQAIAFLFQSNGFTIYHLGK